MALNDDQADRPEEVDLGRAGIPVGQEALDAQPPRFQITVNKRRLVITLCAVALGLAVGFLGLADDPPDRAQLGHVTAP